MYCSLRLTLLVILFRVHGYLILIIDALKSFYSCCSHSSLVSSSADHTQKLRKGPGHTPESEFLTDHVWPLPNNDCVKIVTPFLENGNKATQLFASSFSNTDHAHASLVPRPFLPPVFDRILYAKTEGEGLGERVTCVTSGRHEGRCEGGGDRSL